MGSSLGISDDIHHETKSRVAVIMVPFPAQGHLNQLLQLSCLISSYGLHVYYAGSAVHNRQTKARANGLDPQEVARINFHDMTLPAFPCPPPDPNSKDKFPSHLQPAWDASMSLREPFAAFCEEMSRKFRRIVIVCDPIMAAVVQDAASIENAETYVFNCVSAISQASFIWGLQGKPIRINDDIELPPYKLSVSEEFLYFASVQFQHAETRAGDIHNTCRLMEGPFIDLLKREAIKENRKSWAIGPILPSIFSSVENKPESHHRCFQWLDKQEPNSVIFVSFGTTISCEGMESEHGAGSSIHDRECCEKINGDRGRLHDKEEGGGVGSHRQRSHSARRYFSA